MRRILLTALALIMLTASQADAAIVRIVIDDMIHPITDEFFGRAVDRAAQMNAEAIVVELRTPGGLETSMRSIVQRIFRSRVPVVIYVSPSGSRAASAGFFILEAADVAAMAPGTNTGAAHPVLLGGEKMDETMKTKVANDAAAFMRTIALKRGRNVAVAESAILQSKSFTEQEAIAQHLIDVIAPDLPSLLRSLEGRAVRRFDGTTVTLHLAGKPVTTLPMTLRQQLLSWIMDPNVAFILLSLGGLALWAEFNHPGAIVPGVVGMISILLAVFALNLLPTRFAAIVLLLAAFALFALEAKFVSHGVLGIGGVVCMIIGALLLVDGPIPEMRVNLLTAIAVSVPFGIITIFLMGLVIRARQHRVTTGSEGMVGEVGVARTALGPDGKVFVHGEIWNAVATSPVGEGAQVRVRGVNGLVLSVEPV